MLRHLIALPLLAMTVAFLSLGAGTSRAAKCPRRMRFDPKRLVCVRDFAAPAPALRLQSPRTVPEGNGTRAQRLAIRKGNRHGARREYSAAFVALRSAWRLGKHLQIALAAADNSRLRGDWNQASEWYERALLLAPQMKGRTAVAALNRRMGRLALLAPGCEGGTPKQCAAYVAALTPLCHRGNPGACNAVGYFKVLKLKKVAEGKRLLRETCQAGVPISCYLYAQAYNRGTKKYQYRPLLPLLKRACDGQVHEACRFLGGYYWEGKGTARDYKLGAFYMQKACDNGVARACTSLGYIYATGKGLSRDQAQAFQLYEQGCRLGDGTACHFLGNRLENALHTGKDEKRALTFYKRACTLGNVSGCVARGRMLSRRTSSADRAEAWSIFTAACAQKFGRGCYRMGIAQQEGIITTRDLPGAYASFKKACDLNYGPACFQAATALLFGRLGQKRNASSAATMLVTACSAEVNQACTRYGYLLERGDGVKKDLFNAAHFYHTACELRDGEGCFRMAMLYAHGKVVNPRGVKRVEYLKRSCQLKYGRGCFGLGLIHERWVDVPPSPVAAQRYYRQGCALKEPDSCKKLKKPRARQR